MADVPSLAVSLRVFFWSFGSALVACLVLVLRTFTSRRSLATSGEDAGQPWEG